MIYTAVIVDGDLIPEIIPLPVSARIPFWVRASTLAGLFATVFLLPIRGLGLFAVITTLSGLIEADASAPSHEGESDVSPLVNVAGLPLPGQAAFLGNWHLQSFFVPFFTLAAQTHQHFDALKAWARDKALEAHLAYQDLWFSRRHRKFRRSVKHFFEWPLRLRRY